MDLRCIFRCHNFQTCKTLEGTTNVSTTEVISGKVVHEKPGVECLMVLQKCIREGCKEEKAFVTTGCSNYPYDIEYIKNIMLRSKNIRIIIGDK